MGNVDTDKILDGFFRSGEVEGINFASALDRFNNSEAMLDFFRSFAAHSPSLLSELRSPNAKKLPRYAIAVHSLKGVCYGIAAEDAGLMAEELEKNAETGNLQFVLEKTDAFIASVEKILAGLNGLLVHAEKLLDKPEKDAPDPNLLKQIVEAAKVYHIGEIDKIMYELEKYRYKSHSGLIAWLQERINLSELEEIQEELLKRLEENT
jgi:HPt (histidine-containing phosphotransfer) domain-containing protein